MMNRLNSKHLTNLLLAVLFSVSGALAQTTIPDISGFTINGEEIKLIQLIDSNKPGVIIFWATWCKPCIEELDNLAYIINDSSQEKNYNLITVCIDDSRSSASIKSFVSGKRWQFTVISDKNQDIKRAMNVTDVPQYYIFNKEGLLVKRHTGYIPGDEELMIDELIELGNEK